MNEVCRNDEYVGMAGLVHAVCRGGDGYPAPNARGAVPAASLVGNIQGTVSTRHIPRRRGCIEMFQPFSLASAVGSEEALRENRPPIASCGGRAPIDEVSFRCYLIPQGK